MKSAPPSMGGSASTMTCVTMLTLLASIAMMFVITGAPGYALSFVLFWTLAYALVHIY